MDPHPLHDPEFEPYKPPTSGLTAGSRPRHEPMSCLRALATTLLVGISCLIAFSETCSALSVPFLAHRNVVPGPMSLLGAIGVGAVVALLVGVGLTKVLNSFHRRPAGSDRPPEEKPR